MASNDVKREFNECEDMDIIAQTALPKWELVVRLGLDTRRPCLAIYPTLDLLIVDFVLGHWANGSIRKQTRDTRIHHAREEKYDDHIWGILAVSKRRRILQKGWQPRAASSPLHPAHPFVLQ